MNLKVVLGFSLLVFCGFVDAIFFPKDTEKSTTTENYNQNNNVSTNKPETTSHRSFFNKLFGDKPKSPHEVDGLGTRPGPAVFETGGNQTSNPLKSETTSQSIYQETPIFQSNTSSYGDTLLDVCKALNLSSFLEYMQAANLMDVLSCKEPVTIFAPSNAAFSAMDFREKNLFRQSQGPQSNVKMVLSYHISKGPGLKTTDMKNEQLLETLNGTTKIRINIYKDKVTSKNFYTVTGAKISTSDKGASQCMVHVIEKVLTKFPTNTVLETLDKISKFKSFSKAVKDNGVDKDISGDGPFTIFVPIEQAMIKASANAAKTSKDILINHFVSGTYFTPSMYDKFELPSLHGNKLIFEYHKSIIADMIRVNNATLFETDIPCTNGVIHAVNNILDIAS